MGAEFRAELEDMEVRMDEKIDLRNTSIATNGAPSFFEGRELYHSILINTSKSLKVLRMEQKLTKLEKN